MKYIEDVGAVNLSNVTCKGLPTLGVGEYTGRFIGTSKDDDDKQWITLATTKGAHIEQSDLDVSHLELNQPVKFKIEPVYGAIAVMNGSRYKLVENGVELTKFIPLAELYQYIKDNDVKLAEPKITKIGPDNE